jgi:branched-chain amino acid transport system permease protein
MLASWLFFASVPLWIERVGLYQYLGVEILIFATYALAFNLVLGHAGLPSFGHGAFFGIGAYAFGLAQFNVVPNLWVCLGVATLAAAMSGALVAAFISHRRGIYYALMTIAFGQVLWFVAVKWHSVTGGEDGLLNIVRPVAGFGLNDCVYVNGNELRYPVEWLGKGTDVSALAGQTVRIVIRMRGARLYSLQFAD